jgi:DNA repair protein RadC
MTKKIYENAIVNWPEEERPREKLLNQGAEQLTNGELIAILLRVGVKGKSAVDLARNILQELGSLRALESWEPEELCELHGLSYAKVAQIKAAIELGKRILSEEKRTFGQVYSSQQVFDYLLPSSRDLNRELFKAIFLNARNQIVKESIISSGTLTSSAIYPREIMSLAYRTGAAAVVFSHNHPSGSTTPSSEDRRVTRELVVAGEAIQVSVVDHLIIGENQYFSFADEGYVEKCKDEYREFIKR